MEGFAGFTVESIDHDDDPMVVARAAEEELLGAYNGKREILGDEAMSKLQAQIMLRIIDTRWMSHLQEMDYLKAGIGLRAIGQRDPLVEYKNEAHRAFGELTDGMYESFLRTILRLQIARKEEAEIGEARNPLEGKLSYSNPEKTLSAESKTASAGRDAAQPGQPPKPVEPSHPKTFVKDKDDPYANVGRNDPCPCGSGKKFKKCHGANRG